MLALQPWGQLQKLAQNFKGSPHFHTVFGKAGVESAVESSTLFHPQQQVCCGEFKQKCGKCASGVESQTLAKHVQPQGGTLVELWAPIGYTEC